MEKERRDQCVFKHLLGLTRVDIETFCIGTSTRSRVALLLNKRGSGGGRSSIRRWWPIFDTKARHFSRLRIIMPTGKGWEGSPRCQIIS